MASALPEETPSKAELDVRVLGPLRVARHAREISPGGKQQSTLLALLLARSGRPTSTQELIQLLWGDAAPASAVNTVQKYVGSLRRVLEPELAARQTGSLLKKQGNAYSWNTNASNLDLVCFRDYVRDAARLAEASRFAEALEVYVRAVEVWKGPAGDGLDLSASAEAVFAALDREFFDACIEAARIAIDLDQPKRVLSAVRLAASLAPLNEPLQASLISLLGAAGLQSEAISEYQAVRSRLSDQLGIDPGVVLSAAYQGVLLGTPALGVPRVTDPARALQDDLACLVGRETETSIVRGVVEAAASGESSVLLVEGEPGLGKTMLLEKANEIAKARGMLAVWGRCVYGSGSPAMRPWVQIVASLLAHVPESDRRILSPAVSGLVLDGDPGGDLAAVLPDVGAQFRLFEGVSRVLNHVARAEPLVLILDDLQWADSASLSMLTHLSSQLPPGIAIVAAFRDRAPVPGWDLIRALAQLSRQPRHRRIRLSPLSLEETTSLVRREASEAADEHASTRIYERTAGNPFLVRELARLLGDGRSSFTTDALDRAVPSSVLDIVRDRTHAMPSEARHLLEVAALIGRVVDVSLLSRAAGIDVELTLALLDRLAAEGLVRSAASDPHSFEFTHDLFRESVLQSTPRPGIALLHRQIAEALVATGSNAEAVAEHLWAAGALADPSQTVNALIRAAGIAIGRSAYEVAENHLKSAAQLAQRAGLAELELTATSHLVAIVGMRAGYVGPTVELLRRAENLARMLGRDREAADFLFSRWAAHSQGIQLVQAETLAQELLTRGESSSDPIIRAYGWHAWGFHQWDVGNIEQAYVYLKKANATAFGSSRGREVDPLRRDLQLLWPVMLGLMMGLRGDLDAAMDQFDRCEREAGSDPYAITVWSAFSVMTAVLVGDLEWALRAAEHGIVADPECTFTFLGSYQRLGRHWALALSGSEPSVHIAQAQSIVDGVFENPPKSGLATWHCLIAEMRLEGGELREAERALDRAEQFMERYGQRYAEALMMLLRARLLRAQQQSSADVRAVAEHARDLAVARGANIFAERATVFLKQLERVDR